MMTREAIIGRTIKAINQLPDEKIREVSEFVEFIQKRYEEHQLNKGIQQLTSEGRAFEFLKEEEDIYSEDDLKEIFND